MRVETTIEINASAEKVWNILMDFKNYGHWNPFIKSVEGNVAQGKKIKVVLNGMKLKPIVHSLNRFKRFSWKGKIAIRGLFDGHHQFEIKEIAANRVSFRHFEDFSGILLPVFKKKLLRDIKPEFEKMNSVLKERAEQI